MGKRLFQMLDEMNHEDIENNTRLVELSSNFVSGQKVKAGAHVTMGVEYSSFTDILSEKKIPVLVLVDRDEYNKRKDNGR